MQATYSQVWGHIATHTPFPNTTRATESLDNSAGISWLFTIAPGASQTFSHLHDLLAHRQRGATAAPAAAPTRRRAAERGLRAERAARRAAAQQVREPPVLPHPRSQGIPADSRRDDDQAAEDDARLAGAAVGHDRRPRGLPRGRFAVRITALTTTGRTTKGTRHYRTCRGKLRAASPRSRDLARPTASPVAHNGRRVPFYEYRRPDGTILEVMQKMTDPPLAEDPDTGVPLERIFHPIAVHFKGKGFYNTDYGTKKRAREKAETDSTAKKDDAKGSDTKSETAKSETAKSDSAASSTTSDDAAKPTKSSKD